MKGCDDKLKTSGTSLSGFLFDREKKVHQLKELEIYMLNRNGEKVGHGVRKHSVGLDPS